MQIAPQAAINETLMVTTRTVLYCTSDITAQSPLLKWGFGCATEARFSEKVIEGTWVPRHKDLFCSHPCLQE